MEGIKQTIIDKIESIIDTSITSMQKISIGYTNSIYSLNNKYILRFCSNPNNMTNFTRASEFCTSYSESVNCPHIIYSEHDKDTDEAWQLEEKFSGVNLSAKWGALSENQREVIIAKICEELKRIHQIPIRLVFEKEFAPNEWRKKFIRDIEKKCLKLESKYANRSIFNEIQSYVEAYASCLSEVNYAICHTDLHFDNIMINDNEDILFLDFDRLRISSIDYELDIISVMANHPEIVINSSCLFTPLTKNDFSNVISYFKKYYPELFKFKDLKYRLSIYSLKHYLAAISYAKDKEAVFDIIRSIIRR